MRSWASFVLVGAGRSEVAQMLFGITNPRQGEIKVDGRVARPRSPRHAMQLGVSFYLKTATNKGWCCSFRFARTRLSRSFGNFPTERDSFTVPGRNRSLVISSTGCVWWQPVWSDGQIPSRGGNQRTKVLLGQMAYSVSKSPHSRSADARY